MDAFVQVVIDRGVHGDALEAVREVLLVEVHPVVLGEPVEERGAVRVLGEVGEDVQRPAHVGDETKPCLAARSRAATHRLRLVRLGPRSLEKVNVFDVEQVDPLLETAVEHDEAHLVAVHVGGALVVHADDGLHGLLIEGAIECARGGEQSECLLGRVLLRGREAAFVVEGGGEAVRQQRRCDDLRAVASEVDVGVDEMLVKRPPLRGVQAIQRPDLLNERHHLRRVRRHLLHDARLVEPGLVEALVALDFRPVLHASDAAGALGLLLEVRHRRRLVLHRRARDRLVLALDAFALTDRRGHFREELRVSAFVRMVFDGPFAILSSCANADRAQELVLHHGVVCVCVFNKYGRFFYLLCIFTIWLTICRST